MRYYVTIEQKEHPVDIIARATGGFEVQIDGHTAAADVVVLGDTLSIIVDGKVIDLTLEGKLPKVGVVTGGKRVYLEVESDRTKAANAAKSKGGAGGDDLVCSPMPGRVLKLLVSVGDEVAVNQPLIVVEAMKMENDLRAGKAGRIEQIFVQAGAAVEAGAKLVKIA